MNKELHNEQTEQITWEEGYRELWNAMKEWVTSDRENEQSWKPAWMNILAVMDRHNETEFVQSSNLPSEVNNEQEEQPRGVIPLDDEDSESSVYNEHLNKLMNKYKAGELFKIADVMRECSVERGQVYNIIKHWEARGRIVKARRANYYWTN